MHGGTEMIKKIIMIITFVGCVCNANAAKVKVSDNVYDTKTIYWQAFRDVVNDMKNKYQPDIQADMWDWFAFGVINNKDMLYSDADLVNLCMESIERVNVCMDFIDMYHNYNSGDSNDCVAATNTQVEFGIWNAKGTFNEVYAKCNQHQDTAWHYEDGSVEPESYSGESFVGQCKVFLNDVKRCERHLLKYYAEKIQSNNNEKQKKQYECMFNLLQTGQIMLPVTEMEKQCI